MSRRRNDIDWLRVIAILSVFVFHCTRFFFPQGWHLKNQEHNVVIFWVMYCALLPWVMELFFLLSGVSAWYALRSRTGGNFLKERFKRLLVPLYTIGLFILLPPQFYFDEITNAGYTGSFIGIIPKYFARLGLPCISEWPLKLVPVPFPGHLWFLQLLFLISVIILPLLLLLKTDRAQQYISTLAGWCEHCGGIFLFIIPLVLSLIAFKGLSAGQKTWTDFLWYSLYFLIGYATAADRRFTEAFAKNMWSCLALWTAAFFGIILLVKVSGYAPFGPQSWSMQFALYQIIWGVCSWSAVVFMLGLGAKYLQFRPRVLDYMSEAVLPFYLLHQTIILTVGYFVIRADMGIPFKISVIAAVSFSLILAVYELLVRPFNPVRFLFGMEKKGVRP